MKRAIIYVRVSTTRQADEGISIDAQTDQCRKKAQELGAGVLQIFHDEDITGTSAVKRQAFQRAIHYCAVNDVDYFIVWSTSRFARNKLDAARYKLLLRESGTRLVYASMNIDSDTDEGWFTDSIMEIMDERISRQISRDTRRAMLKNAEEGWFNGGRAPFGYQITSQGKRRKLVPNDAGNHWCRKPSAVLRRGRAPLPSPAALLGAAIPGAGPNGRPPVCRIC